MISIKKDKIGELEAYICFQGNIKCGFVTFEISDKIYVIEVSGEKEFIRPLLLSVIHFANITNCSKISLEKTNNKQDLLALNFPEQIDPKTFSSCECKNN